MSVPKEVIELRRSILENSSGVSGVTPRQLHDWLDSGRDVMILDIHPDEQYAKKHLPGARNACVYEVVFLSNVKQVAPEPEKEIVVCGSGDASLGALVAADKLVRAGYRKVYELIGGTEAWRNAGYPLEGLEAEAPNFSGNRPCIEDRLYIVDRKQSIIEWVGRNANWKHTGTVSLLKGRIEADHGRFQGSFEIDMKSLTNQSVSDEPLRKVLIDHLESDDFFHVDRFPVATFTLESARELIDATPGAPNFEIEGTLILRGVSAPLNFPATVGSLQDGGLSAEAHFDIDRTRWNVIYGSGRFFDHLGIHLVFDAVSIQLKIVAR